MATRQDDIEAIYNAALQKKSSAERTAYLTAVCADDQAKRARVEQLLAAHDKAGDFLENPVFNMEITLDESPIQEGPGTIIGPYKLLERIGEGGMAVVYMAEQTEPIRRRVALKIIKLGMDTKSVIARFEAERQALALMDHPNIAKVLDAGATDTGRPYFVMDLVPGLPITEYCDKNRLSIKERLKLFILVCNAIQHAHQKGIIHRDIKPSNIIVTQHDGKPVPKVIDFGIAKATNQRLTEKTLFTRHAHIIGTPAYMSPEQAELSDLDVDTRTDIYSLGILLYELLTGSTPFGDEQLRQAGYLKMQKIICEEEPTKPSTKLSTLGQALTDIAKWHDCSPESMPRLVRGDLDWIVMKSLEKNRSRRYDTASALAIDIQRHLNNKPVEAAAPSISYKLHKFVRRHRIFVIAGSSSAALLLVVVVVSVMYAHERAIHAQESEDARQRITDLLAGSYVDQAQALCEQGHVGRGMLWLAHSLQVAPDESGELGRAVRTSLASWYGQLHSLRTVVQYPPIQYPPLVGSFIESPVGTFTMTGLGTDIWNASDQFSFAYKILTGPGSIVARIDSLENTHDWAKAGVMIREKLDSGSKHVFICITPANGISFQSRRDSGATCINTNNTGITAPYWLKLQRDSEDNFKAWHSADGTTWQSIGDSLKTNIPMNSDVYVGLAVTSHSAGKTCKAVFSNVGTTGSVSAKWVHRNIGIKNNATGRLVPNQINAVAFSPDGSQILAACRDGTIRFCDGVTGEPMDKLLRHGSEVVAAAFSPNGMLIATGGSDGSVRLWDAVTLKPVGEKMQHGKGLVMAFSADSSQLITGGGDGAVRFWDANTGKSIGRGFQYEGETRWHSVRAVACCPEGIRVVLTTGWSRHQMFDAESGEPIGPPITLSKTVFAVLISSDGRRFITGDGGGTIRIWDAATGEQVQEPISHGGVTYTLAFSPDGSRIVSGGASRMARLWDAVTGAPIGGPMRQRSTVTSAAFSPDGTCLVTGNQDGVVQQWNLVQDRYAGKTVETKGRICGASFGRNGLWILEQIDGMVQFRNVTTGEPVGKPFSGSAQIRLTSLSPDCSVLVTQKAPYTPNLLLHDVATGRILGELYHQEPHCVVFSPDCSRIITGGEDNIARLWDVATLKCVAEFHQFQGVVSKAAFSPDGSKLLIGSYDGTTRLWDSATLEQISEPLIHQSEVKGLAFSPDGTRILIGFADGTIRLYDATALKPIGTPLQHVKLVSSVDFSPDGSKLLACSIDGTARLWDAETLKPIGPPLEHNLGWSNASFSPDGSQILIRSSDRAQLWQAPSGPLVGDCERIVWWVQVITGMELDSTGGINVLDIATWQQRRRRLQELGGPPKRTLAVSGQRSETKGL
jgi:WD40 repeat protein/serine/threonine protein kinase